MWPFIRTRCEGHQGIIGAGTIYRRSHSTNASAIQMAAGIVGRRSSLWVCSRVSSRIRFDAAPCFVSRALAVALALAAVQAMFQIHDIGHKGDQKTILVGVKDFTPPFIGTNKIAQFTVTLVWRLGAGS